MKIPVIDRHTLASVQLLDVRDVRVMDIVQHVQRTAHRTPHLVVSPLERRHVDMNLVVKTLALVDHARHHSAVRLAERREHRRNATAV